MTKLQILFNKKDNVDRSYPYDKLIEFSSAANFAQKQEVENKQFAADENKTVRRIIDMMKLKVIKVRKMMMYWSQVNRKWSCDEDGVHISTKWLPIPRSFMSALSDPQA